MTNIWSLRCSLDPFGARLPETLSLHARSFSESPLFLVLFKQRRCRFTKLPLLEDTMFLGVRSKKYRYRFRIKKCSPTVALLYCCMNCSFYFPHTAIQEREPKIILIRPVESTPEGELRGERGGRTFTHVKY